MKYQALLLILVFGCSQKSDYIPNPQAVELNNRAVKLMYADPFSENTNSQVYLNAIILLDSALFLDKKNSVIYANKFDALVKLGRLQDARELMQMATENISNYVEGYVSIGMIYDHANKQESALANYKKAIEALDLRNKKASKQQKIHNQVELAFLMILMGEEEKGQKMLEALSKKYPSDINIQMQVESFKSFDKKEFLREKFEKIKPLNP